MIAAIHARRDNPDPSAQSPVTQSAAPVTGGNPPAQWELSCEHRADRMRKGFAQGREGKAMS